MEENFRTAFTVYVNLYNYVV